MSRRLTARRRPSFNSGDKVTTNCPRSPRFHNRKGTVITRKNAYGEIGVSFAASDDIDAYFLPEELTKEGVVHDNPVVRSR